MREQTLVWTDSFIEVFESLQYNGWKYVSEKVIVLTEQGEYLLGRFEAECFDYYDMKFVSDSGWDTPVHRLQEYAYL